MSFPLKYKNEKEIWWEDEYGRPITIEIIDVENEQYIERRYHKNGRLWIEKNYHQGQLHGEYLMRYDDGRLYYKAKRNHGKLINDKYY